MKPAYKLLSIAMAFAILTFSLYAVPAHAASVTGASAYIQVLGNQALSVISDKNLDKARKQAKLEQLFSENVDFAWVGRFVMGRSWREASDAQKARYAVEYKKFLILHYTSRFTSLSSGTFKVMGEKDDGDGEYTVSMQLKSDAPSSEPLSVDYRVRREDGNGVQPVFRIFDVIVEGVGLLTTQRSEFSSVIANKGIDYLIDQLAAKSSSGAI